MFRDSLAKANAEMEQKVIENLPDIDQYPDASESSANEGSDSDSEVVPLDFRTALSQSTADGLGKIMIQAKPMQFKSAEQELDERDRKKKEKARKPRFAPHLVGGNVNPDEDQDFEFQKIQREPFKRNDKDVVFLESGFDTEKIFGEVELPCDLAVRKNNSIKAEIVDKRSSTERRAASRSTSNEKSPERKTLFQAERLFSAKGRKPEQSVVP